MAVKKIFTFDELNQMHTFASSMKDQYNAATDGHTFWERMQHNVEAAMTLQMQENFGIEPPASLQNETYKANKKAIKDLRKSDVQVNKDEKRVEEIQKKQA
jgi:hypothetical protein